MGPWLPECCPALRDAIHRKAEPPNFQCGITTYWGCNAGYQIRGGKNQTKQNKMQRPNGLCSLSWALMQKKISALKLSDAIKKEVCARTYVVCVCKCVCVL